MSVEGFHSRSLSLVWITSTKRAIFQFIAVGGLIHNSRKQFFITGFLFIPSRLATLGSASGKEILEEDSLLIKKCRGNGPAV